MPAESPPSTWFYVLLVALYVLWVIIGLLVIKLLVTQSRWRRPLHGNGLMLWALLLLIIAGEISRARAITNPPPPYPPSLMLTLVASACITWWLWQQLELIPRWIREHLHLRRQWRDSQSDPTEGDPPHADRR